jgi:site-specific DNA recombinase
MTELAGMWAAKELSSLEWKAAREPIEARLYSTTRQLGQITGGHTLSGLVGNGSQLRDSWATLNLSRQAAIITAILDFATITPAKTRGRTFDPFRIVPTWSR